jgi:CheY-like chemotaxis protein
MDLQMPNIDGLNATKIIRSLKLSKQPYIIALTGNVFVENVQECYESGMDNFLSKPLDLESLKTVMDLFV